jgi:hypothetical protein
MVLYSRGNSFAIFSGKCFAIIIEGAGHWTCRVACFFANLIDQAATVMWSEGAGSVAGAVFC